MKTQKIKTSKRGKPQRRSNRGWPKGYFDKAFGGIKDPTFKRGPQCMFCAARAKRALAARRKKRAQSKEA